MEKRDPVTRDARQAAIEKLLAIPEVRLARDLWCRGSLTAGRTVVYPVPDGTMHRVHVVPVLSVDEFLDYALALASHPRCAVKFSTLAGGSCMRLEHATGKHFSAEKGPRLFVWERPLEGDESEWLALEQAAAEDEKVRTVLETHRAEGLQAVMDALRELEKTDPPAVPSPPTDSTTEPPSGTVFVATGAP